MNQNKFNKLKSGVYTGSIGDASLQFFRTTGGSTSSVNDAESKFLAASGYSSGSLADRWKAFLTANGYTGTINDAQAKWWVNKAP